MAVGASLTGCGSESSDATNTGGTLAGGTGDEVAPLAYEYIPIIKSGDVLPGGVKLAEKGIRYSLQSNLSSPPPFMGAVCLTDSRHIYFHALDDTQTRGIYRIDVDAKYGRSDARRVIREGDRLPDGTLVEDFSDGDVNNGDDFFIGVVDDKGVNSLQYAAGGGSFNPLVKSGSGLARVRLAEEIVQSQAISDQGNLLFVAEYLNEAEDAQGDGLFYIPAGRPQEARLLLANQALVPGTTCAIQTMSTTEITPQGRYIVQGSIAASVGGASANASREPQMVLLQGNIGETPEVLALDRALSAGTDAFRGSVFMCPRLNPAPRSQEVAYIVQVNENQTDLRLGNTLVATADMRGVSGTRTPRGSTMLSFLPPCFHGRHIYFETFTNDGMEIVRWTRRLQGGRPLLETVLARGDRVNGKIVETILFGCLPEAINASGEFAAIVEFTDGETDIFLGAPR